MLILHIKISYCDDCLYHIRIAPDISSTAMIALWSVWNFTYGLLSNSTQTYNDSLVLSFKVYLVYIHILNISWYPMQQLMTIINMKHFFILLLLVVWLGLYAWIIFQMASFSEFPYTASIVCNCLQLIVHYVMTDVTLAWSFSADQIAMWPLIWVTR